MSIRSHTTLIAALLLTLLLVSTSAMAAQLPEKCSLIPDKGPCKALIEKFYFNQQSGKCTPYFYDGCGKIVPFDSLEQCKADCEQLTAKSGLKHDPLESDPRYKEIFKGIDAEVNETLAKHPRRGSMGFVHIFWETKQRILKQKYNIDWHSPAELNPQVLFD